MDVGCGNGEFLELMRDAGYDVFGIDRAVPVRLCRERGLPAEVADFLDMVETDRFENLRAAVALQR